MGNVLAERDPRGERKRLNGLVLHSMGLGCQGCQPESESHVVDLTDLPLTSINKYLLTVSLYRELIIVTITFN